MTLYFASCAVLAWVCPGGMLGGFVPAGLKPLVCLPAIEQHQDFETRIPDVNKWLADFKDLDACKVTEFKNGRESELKIGTLIELRR